MSDQLDEQVRTRLLDAYHGGWMNEDEMLTHVADLLARARAEGAAEAGERWQQKWKRRGVVIERLKAERDQYKRESAELMGLVDGKTARLLAEREIAVRAEGGSDE